MKKIILPFNFSKFGPFMKKVFIMKYMFNSHKIWELWDLRWSSNISTSKTYIMIFWCFWNVCFYVLGNVYLCKNTILINTFLLFLSSVSESSDFSYVCHCGCNCSLPWYFEDCYLSSQLWWLCWTWNRITHSSPCIAHPVKSTCSVYLSEISDIEGSSGNYFTV